MIERPTGVIDSKTLTREERIMNHAGLWFETKYLPAEQHTPTDRVAENWRYDSRFYVNPTAVESAQSWVWNHCIAALEMHQFAIQHGLAATQKRNPFRYTMPEKDTLKVLIEEAIYPQIKQLNNAPSKRYEAFGGITEVNQAIKENIRDITLLHYYLGELCAEINRTETIDHSLPLHPSTLETESISKILTSLTHRSDATIKNLATETKAVAALLNQKTTSLSEQINTSQGKTVLQKDNVRYVDFSKPRGGRG